MLIFASHHKQSCITLCPNCAWHICIHVDTANDVVYELVAEPDQGPQAEGQQGEEAVEQAPKEAANPADLQGKPRSITII